MNLLGKLQNKLKGEPVSNSTGSAEESIKALNNLPDSEKLKVLDYLQSLSNLHDNNE
jgi:hypothetical protein